MARYKWVEESPRLLLVLVEYRRVPGSIVRVEPHRIDMLDISGFDAPYRNNGTDGAFASAPSIF